MYRPPVLYPVLDVSFLPKENRAASLSAWAQSLLTAGVTLLQYRNKTEDDRLQLADAKVLRAELPVGQVSLIMNDRPDLAVLADFDGVHVGQTDLSPEAARRIVGEGKLVGVSTHSEEQLKKAIDTPVDYVAIGPVFATKTKADASPVVGLEGVRLARSLTKKPIVAIGGITQQNALSVVEAGADSLALISAIFASSSPAKNIRDFLSLFL